MLALKLERKRKVHYITFSRSILASAPIRVSLMRFTIHFSPSSRVKLRRSDKSLREISDQHISLRQCRRDNPRYQSSDAYQIPRIIQNVTLEFPQKESVFNHVDRLVQRFLRSKSNSTYSSFNNVVTGS
ncbi:hypothetical protein M378DRAFT_375620 [Amanita muscaria Koide BX008]|uniref:Uncharacterized protein n=1 Tax=Amanita muscaria (strain Koide BX008) TaxID=946122 RepID=A0A0C2WLS6_AMAMK|nr:hypothetical protein M378DRAFT_375620 [Amanita muscaria Koide BX008]